jgi:hypothetical protein
MKRRDFLLSTGAATLGLSAFSACRIFGQEKKRQRVLYFTRSAGFEHSVVKRKGKELSHSEKVLTEMGRKAGFEVVCTKDGRVFDEDLGQYDLIAFYTSGVLTDPVKDRDEPPMTRQGLQRLLDAIAAGKGFVGLHASTDSFHSTPGQASPFLAMLGAEFISHGPAQKATMRVTSAKFPGAEGLGDSFRFHDEWYAQKNFVKDLHVILVQETEGMVGDQYKRPPYPATWARMHEKGRVFYTSMGHFENVWTNKLFQQVLLGGMAWAMRNVDAGITPNIDEVTPKANQLSM